MPSLLFSSRRFDWGGAVGKRRAGRNRKDPEPRAAAAELEDDAQGKRYYRIGEVSRITGVKPYVLRYWESEFRWMAPQKSRSKQRLYRRRDIDMILLIKKTALRTALHDCRRAQEVARVRRRPRPRVGQSRDRDRSPLPLPKNTLRTRIHPRDALIFDEPIRRFRTWAFRSECQTPGRARSVPCVRSESPWWRPLIQSR